MSTVDYSKFQRQLTQVLQQQPESVLRNLTIFVSEEMAELMLFSRHARATPHYNFVCWYKGYPVIKSDLNEGQHWQFGMSVAGEKRIIAVF